MKLHPLQKSTPLFWLLWLLLPTLAWAQQPTAKKTKSIAQNGAVKIKKIETKAATTAKDDDIIEQITKKERADELLKLRKASKVFRKAANEYLKEIGALVRKQYRERRTLIAGGYENRITGLERKEQLIRLRAIQRFIAFIRKYPKHHKFTPDAMYRLAELYYDEEFIQYLASSKKYEEDIQRFENKELSIEPLQPKKQFPSTILWLTKLINRFPAYRYTPTAYYLLGYCKNEEGNSQEAIAYFRSITERFTPDKFPKQKDVYVEAWVRMGEYYFREGKRKKSKQAYRTVLKFPKHPMYDKALYKLAWAHYLSDEFETSVNLFTQLLDLYIKREKAGKKGGAELRKEAIQYIANSFVDEKWGTPQKAVNYLQKIGIKKPYARKILLQLSDNYFNQLNWDMVIATNRQLLSLYPYHPDNPLLQEKIVRAFEKKKDLNRSLLERSKFPPMFGKKSEWAKVNQKNPRAREMVNKIVSKNIYRTAIYRHEYCNIRRQAAGKEKDPLKQRTLLKEAIEHCKVAGENYRSFLDKNKHHKDAYNLNWYLADSLYFSGNFKEAQKYFKVVRDWPNEKKYFQEASYSLIDSLVQLVNKECSFKKIRRACELASARKKEEFKEDKGKKKKKKKKKAKTYRKKKVAKLPIPSLQKQLIESREFFFKSVKDKKDDRIPEQMYLMGRIYFAYDHLVSARKQLKTFIERYPRHKLSQFAGDMIISTYQKEGRLDDMIFAMDDLKKYGLRFKYEKELKVGVAFIKAKRLQREGKHEKAAEAYISAVNKDPRNKDAPAGLWNAALMYEKANRFGTALQIYERVIRDYPRWKMTDQALFYVALNAEKFFNFSKAISRYMKLVNNFKTSKKRADALYNAALLLENLQRYEKAAKAYQRYATDPSFRSRPESPDMLYKAAMVYQKMKRPSDMISVLKQYIRRYESKPKHVRKVMEAYGLIMESYEKESKPWSQMKAEYEKVINAFSRLKGRMQPVDISITRKYPAKATYKLAMNEYNKFLALQMDSTNPKVQKTQLEKKSASYQLSSSKLSKVATYGSPPWLLCALYRIAEGKQKIAAMIQKAPLPKIKGLTWTEEAKEIFEEKRDQNFIMPLENQAKSLYEKAVQTAQKFHYQNQCTLKAHEALNRMDPNFPLPKKLHNQEKFGTSSPLPLITKIKKKKKKKIKLSKPKVSKTPKSRSPAQPAPRAPVSPR